MEKAGEATGEGSESDRTQRRQEVGEVAEPVERSDAGRLREALKPESKAAREPGDLTPEKVAEYASALRNNEAVREPSETSKVLTEYPEVAGHTLVLDTTKLSNWSDAKTHFDRGIKFEDDFAAIKIDENRLWVQTRPNERTIDTFLIDTDNDRVQVQSIKTIDPALPSYKDSPATMYRRLEKYAEDARNYQRPSFIGDTQVPQDFSQEQDLVIGIPDSGITDKHAAKFNELVLKYNAADKIPRLNIIFVEAPR